MPWHAHGAIGVSFCVQHVEGVVKKGGGSLGCYRSHWSEEGGEGEGESCCPAVKLGVLPPPIIEIRQRRVTGGRIGLGEAVVRI